MKKEEKEEIDQQKNSNKSLKRGIVAGAAGVAGAGVGYAASHIDDILPDGGDEIDDVDPDDNEDGSFFEKLASFRSNGVHGNPDGGHATNAAGAAQGHGHADTANGDEDASVSVNVVSDPDDEPVAHATPVVEYDGNADNVAHIDIDDSDISSPAVDYDIQPEVADIDDDIYDPSADSFDA